MNKAENNIAEQLTGKSSLKQVNVEELQQLTEHYPYFSAAHYLLSKKLKQENDNSFLSTVQKTVLYFSNPHWLHYQLMQTDEPTPVIETQQQIVVQDAVIKETEDEVINTSNKQTDNFQDEDIDELIEETMQQSVEQEETFLDEQTSEMEELTDEKKAQHDEVEKMHSDAEQNHDSLQEITPTTKVYNEPELPPLDEEEKIEHVATNKEEIESNTRLSELLDEQAKEFNKPVDENVTIPIITEPYHTVDYFASQGIKLNQQEEEQPNDNLGNKVRKFTDWLKQMKRISPQPGDLGTTKEMETAVQTSAASSNEPKEIITEAMAEVLLKQGKMDKAIELYMKLSFLNPAKTAYFAAKIQQLKQV